MSRGEDEEWTEDEEAVRRVVVAQLGPALAARVSDSMMMRFVRSFYYEQPRAEQTALKLRQTLEWRAEFGTDTLLTAPDEALVGETKAYRRLFKIDMFGRDKQGHAVICFRVGRIEPTALFAGLSMDSIKRHFIRDFEYFTLRKDHCSAVAGAPRYKHVVVLDFAGFGMTHMGRRFRGPMKELIGWLSSYYCEAVQKQYFLNAPFSFRSLWAIVRSPTTTAPQPPPPAARCLPSGGAKC